MENFSIPKNVTLTYNIISTPSMTATQYLRKNIEDMKKFTKGEYLSSKRLRIIVDNLWLTPELPTYHSHTNERVKENIKYPKNK